MTKSSKLWALIIIFLIAVIIIGSLIIWSKYRPNQPLEIAISPAEEWQGNIFIDGAVNNPGIYPLTTDNTINDIIQAAGGTIAGADFNQMKLYIPQIGESELPQKVNINRAEVWLLQALPGIGEVRAQAIIDYRQQNGPFRNINKLTEVEGIGTDTFEKIKHLITVGD
jgi:competence protein ComEA